MINLSQISETRVGLSQSVLEINQETQGNLEVTEAIISIEKARDRLLRSISISLVCAIL